MGEELSETMTGEKANEYTGPQANHDGEGTIILDFKWESYALSPNRAELMAEDIQSSEEDGSTIDFELERYILTEDQTESLVSDLEESAAEARDTQ